MKKIICLLVFIAPLIVVAQSSDTTKVEQYCEMVATGRMLSTKVNIDVTYGEERKFFKIYGVRDENGKLKKFNSVVDALNYLGQQGWKMVNAFPVSEANGPKVFHYIFKKEFLKSEVDKAENVDQ
jgi:hypothetical protein